MVAISGLLSLSLTSCLGGSNSSSPNATTGGGGEGETVVIPSGKSEQSYFQSVMTRSYSSNVVPSIGNPNLLVIPVDFSDYTCSSLDGGCKGSKERIEDGFFGKREEGEQIESLASFYEKSSFDKLHLQGYVTDWQRAPHSAKSIVSKSSSEFLSYIENNIINKTLAKLEKQGVDISKFDTDGDGLIDGVWVVYSLSYDPDVSKLDDPNGNFWAYTYWASEDVSYANGSTYVGTFAFASYSFFDEGGYTTKPDMHTFIHETGHMLGLMDYYNYDAGDESSTTPYLAPAGCLDMMDFNIGDHMAYSKFLLGWIEPTVIKESGEVTLTSYSDTGKAIIIGPESYSGLASGEYLIMEYYTPTNLFKYDAEHEYSNGATFYTESGLRVYHIDARLGLLSLEEVDGNVAVNVDQILSSKSQIESALNTVEASDNKFVYPIASNTPSYVYGDNSSVELNEAFLISETFNGNRVANNNDLYKAGSILDRTNYAWHSGEKSSFSVEVVSQNETEMKLNITLK